MKEFKELDVLENTADSVKERIAEEFPPQDDKEKERVFRMSERKYNIKKNNNRADANSIGEETVNGVEVYKRPKWKIFTSIAACLAIVAGVCGAGYMIKHLNGGVPDTVMSEIKDKSTAPFGDFAASDYFIPDYFSDQKTFHFNKHDVDIPYYDGEVIPLEKRQEIADFFNSQDWKEAEPNEANEGGRKIKMTPEEIAENYIDFMCVTDGEIRQISISSENILTYNYFETKEENGDIVCDNNYVQEYEIDWELFRSTINDILYGSYAEKNAAPFGDFSELEYYIPNSDISSMQEIRIADSTNSNAVFKLMSGTEIDAEKRRKLADFFNSYTWEEYTEPISYSQEDSIIFNYNNGSEVRLVQITKDNVLNYLHFNYTNKDGQLYKEPLEGAISQQKYKIDSKLFRETIDSILNDTNENIAPFGDFSELEYYIPENIPEKGENIYLNEDEDNAAFCLMNGKTIEQEKRDKLAEFFNSYDWNKHTGSAEILNELTTPSMLLSGNDPDKETISFCYRNDKEIRMIEIENTNLLVYTHFDYITNENGKLIKVNYGETDETSLPFEVFNIDYELFRNTINSILAEEDNITEKRTEQSEGFEGIVEILEKYDTFRYNDSSEDAAEYKLIYPDTPDTESSFFYGDPLPDDKRHAIINAIKNADWTSEKVPEDERIDYELKGNEAATNFNALYSFVDVTGNDIIFLDIYQNIIEMHICGCEYDEASSAYTVEKEYSNYYIRITSPTFMTDIYNILKDYSE